jgi:hypothetical protein
MMNSEVIRQQSRYFAGRFRSADRREKQIGQIYLRSCVRLRDLDGLHSNWSA